MKVSVIGLGKLGACYAAFFASRGFDVIGVDTDPDKVLRLNEGKAPVEETHLETYIKKYKSRLSATESVEEAVKNSVATFVIVPTPSEKDGSFSLAFAKAAFEHIGLALKQKRGHHLVSLVSTVLPGNSREVLIPALERTAGKKCGKDFGYCYNPSLIALGEVLKNLENPDFLFLGAFDEKSRKTLTRIYKKLYPDLTPESMSIESVELAKIALNSFVTMKITFANVLGQICEKLPHANVSEITQALGKDKRIGSRYLKSGLGYGGPCFPRDNYAFAYMAKRRGIDTPLALATHDVNETMPRRIANLVHSLGASHNIQHIGFLGVSYKPNTKVTEESQALSIARLLQLKGYQIYIYEPDVSDAKTIFGKKAKYYESIKDLITKTEMIFVSNMDNSFLSLPRMISQSSPCRVVVDPWNMFPHNAFSKKGIIYKTIGSGQ